MQWYVYLISIPALCFLAWTIVERIVRPIQAVLRLRQDALARMLALRNMPLPGPRELAVSSSQIRDYDQRVRNVRCAQRIFAELAARFHGLAETEPMICAFMALWGVDPLRAGDELMQLSDLCGAIKIDSRELRRAIEDAHRTASEALAVSPGRSGNELLSIRLEPIILRCSVPSRRQQRSSGKSRVRPRAAPLRASSGYSRARGFAR